MMLAGIRVDLVLAAKDMVEGKDGATMPILYYFIKEDGQWKILSIEVSARLQHNDDAPETEAE